VQQVRSDLARFPPPPISSSRHRTYSLRTIATPPRLRPRFTQHSRSSAACFQSSRSSSAPQSPDAHTRSVPVLVSKQTLRDRIFCGFHDRPWNRYESQEVDIHGALACRVQRPRNLLAAGALPVPHSPSSKYCGRWALSSTLFEAFIFHNTTDNRYNNDKLVTSFRTAPSH
jgi:hypothetical protein